MTSPGPGLDERLARAMSLRRLQRHREAQLECVEILKRDPAHLGALMCYAGIMQSLGRGEAAAETYKRVLELDPREIHANVNLASLYRVGHRPSEALPLLQAALRVDPDCREAQALMAQTLSDLRDTRAAWEYGRKAFGNAPVVLPYDGPPGQAIEVLVLCAWQSVNTPLDHAIDRRFFRQTKLNADFHDPSRPLPPHQVLWNAVGEVEIGAEHLAACERLLKLNQAPVLNHPSKIRPTGRAENARRLAGIPGLVVPKISGFKRGQLEAPDAAAMLTRSGFAFPLLIRATGFQGGLNFGKVEAPEALAEAVRAMPGEELLVIEFKDARDPDGGIRKYRAIMVDGRLYPLHAAVSRDWKIHYFSAGMKDSPENRAEDRAYLEDMEAVLGPKAMAALEGVRDVLDLDYGGIDFSLNRDREVVFFESNATMVVPRPPSAEVWDYRRAPVQRIYDAITAMLRDRTGIREPAGGAPAGPFSLPPPPSPRPRPGAKDGASARGISARDLRLARATGMTKFGMGREARAEYEAMLRERPDDAGVLSLYGALLLEGGDFAEASAALSRAAEAAPGHAQVRAQLGFALLSLRRDAEARAAFEAALELRPGLPDAHRGLAELSVAVGERDAAREHGDKAYSRHARREVAFRGTGLAPAVLVLRSALGGNLPLTELVDRRGFHQSVLMVEYCRPEEPLPIHTLLFNAVGGPDEAPEAQAFVHAVAHRCHADKLNPPERTARCGRAESARLLKGIPGLEVPQAADFTRAELESAGGAALPAKRGLDFPLLLLPRGLHPGAGAARVESAQDLPAALKTLDADLLTAVRFLDGRGEDGFIRKFRVLGVGNRLLPLYAAPAKDWGDPVHGATDAAARERERAFLMDPAGTVGPGAWEALRAVQTALALDYVGLDFCLDPSGKVLLLGCDPARSLVLDSPGPEWEHRREARRRAAEAVNDLLRSRLEHSH